MNRLSCFSLKNTRVCSPTESMLLPFKLKTHFVVIVEACKR